VYDHSKTESNKIILLAKGHGFAFQAAILSMPAKADSLQEVLLMDLQHRG
jgi:hypothetical protein